MYRLESDYLSILLFDDLLMKDDITSLHSHFLPGRVRHSQLVELAAGCEWERAGAGLRGAGVADSL